VIPPASTLVQGVRLLSLDAGNTVIFLDHARLARLSGECGHDVSPAVLVRAEGEAKRLHEKDELVDVDWESRSAPGARGWGRSIGTILLRAGMPRENLRASLETIWKSHVDWNLFSVVPSGLGAALERFRAGGGKVAVVSNSEGMLEELFRNLGILGHFDVIIDSAKVGVEKPDQRIFGFALERTGIGAAETLHLGDTYSTDIVGARAAKIRCALIDPYGHYLGAHADVPRVASVMDAVDAILAG
jgi:putative hydrolase of the HAD superfamily